MSRRGRGPEPMPAHVAPMLAVPGPLPRDEAAYGFEVKWDGVRALSYVTGDRLHVESRNQRDITPRYPELAGLPAALAPHEAVLDGEVVALDEHGRPSFERLQQRMHVADPGAVRRRMHGVPVVYLVFDVLWLDGRSTLSLPYTERRALLDGLGLEAAPGWQVPPWFAGAGTPLLEVSRDKGLEGVVAKRLDSPYEPGRRSRCWIKVKTKLRQEVVVGGWLPGEGNRRGRVGALLVGVYEGDRLRYAGRVGTGFTERLLDELGAELAATERPENPFATPVPHKHARFVEPRMVAEVEFTEWTSEGLLRHPSYKGRRDDKDPREVVRERS